MQDHTILIGGLDKAYMQKLALYLNERMESGIRVELAEWREDSVNKEAVCFINQSKLPGGDTERENDGHWNIVIGTEEFAAALKNQADKILVFSEEMAEDDTHIYPYQTREVLYRKIVARCVQHVGNARRKTDGIAPEIIVVTGGTGTGQMSALAVLGAWILSQQKNVLYLNLTECSGISELLHLEQNEDLSDLILALRRDANTFLGGYTGRLEKMDYICPTGNPQILYELDESDVKRLLECIQHQNYAAVVIALGTIMCGCEEIFSTACQVLLLKEDGLIETCAANEWRELIRKCIGDKAVNIQEITPQKLYGDVTGSQLLYEWMESETGFMLMQILQEKGNTYERRLAGTEETDFRDSGCVEGDFG